MVISPESIKQGDKSAEQTRRMSAPSRHRVKIVGWDFRDHGEGQDVVFEVHDEAGTRRFVRFGLSDLELSSGQLLQFIAAGLQRQPVETDILEPRVYYHMLFNQLVGRRVVLAVVEPSPAESSDP